MNRNTGFTAYKNVPQNRRPATGLYYGARRSVKGPRSHAPRPTLVQKARRSQTTRRHGAVWWSSGGGLVSFISAHRTWPMAGRTACQSGLYHTHAPPSFPESTRHCCTARSGAQRGICQLSRAIFASPVSTCSSSNASDADRLIAVVPCCGVSAPCTAGSSKAGSSSSPSPSRASATACS